MIQVRCPAAECGRIYRVAPDAVGRHIRCQVCGEEFVVETEMADTQAVSMSDTACLIPPAPAFMRKEAAPRESSPRIGRFEIRQKLGQGAFGTVYRAYDPQLEREVAIKVPQSGLLTTIELVERFLREAKAAARLNHPNIVPVYDAGRDGDQYYIASAFIDGLPLSDCIEEYRGNYRLIADLVRKLASALDYAHAQGIVHRDVKPHNVMIDKAGEPHLMDFGVAHVGDAEEKLTHDGAIIGTPAYMSPEQAAGGSADVTADSDQYSLGVILFELLTGQTPFGGTPAIIIFNLLNTTPPTPRSLKPETPLDLDTICQKALGREPGQRYRGCAALGTDLGRFLAGEPTIARPMTRIERFMRWCRRNPAVAGSAVAIALTLVLGTVVSAAFAVSAKEQARIARQQKDRADAALIRLQDESEQKDQALKNARSERDRAEQNATELARRTEELQTTAKLADDRLQELLKSIELLNTETTAKMTAQQKELAEKARAAGIQQRAVLVEKWTRMEKDIQQAIVEFERGNTADGLHGVADVLIDAADTSPPEGVRLSPAEIRAVLIDHLRRTPWMVENSVFAIPTTVAAPEAKGGAKPKQPARIIFNAIGRPVAEVDEVLPLAGADPTSVMIQPREASDSRVRIPDKTYFAMAAAFDKTSKWLIVGGAAAGDTSGVVDMFRRGKHAGRMQFPAEPVERLWLNVQSGVPVMLVQTRSTVGIYSAATRQPIGGLIRSHATIHSMAATPSLSEIYLGLPDGVWIAKAGESQLRSFLAGNKPGTIAVDAKGMHLLVVSEEGQSQVWDCTLREPLASPCVHPRIQASGRNLFASVEDGGLVFEISTPDAAQGGPWIRKWRILNQKPEQTAPTIPLMLSETLLVKSSSLAEVGQFSPVGDRFVARIVSSPASKVANPAGAFVGLFQTGTGRLERTLSVTRDEARNMRQLSFDRNGTMLAILIGRDKVRIFGPEEFLEQVRPVAERVGKIFHIRLSPDGKFLALALDRPAESELLRIYDLSAPTPVSVCETAIENLRSVGWRGLDSRQLVAATKDGRLLSVTLPAKNDAGSSRPRANISHATEFYRFADASITDVLVIPGSESTACGTADGRVVVVDSTGGEQVFVTESKTPIDELRVNTQGTLLAARSAKSVAMWMIASGARAYHSAAGDIGVIDISPDSQMLLTSHELVSVRPGISDLEGLDAATLKKLVTTATGVERRPGLSPRFLEQAEWNALVKELLSSPTVPTSVRLTFEN